MTQTFRVTFKQRKARARKRLEYKLQESYQIDSAVAERLAESLVKQSGLTLAEKQVFIDYESKGWTVLRSGWPDFFCYRDLPDGTRECLGVEVKAGNDEMRPSQEAMHRVLPFKVIVERLGGTTDEPLVNRVPQPLGSEEKDRDVLRALKNEGLSAAQKLREK
jgi:hypothetical protein